MAFGRLHTRLAVAHRDHAVGRVARAAGLGRDQAQDMTGGLSDVIAARVSAGEPLTSHDVAELVRTHDIVSLGMLADEVRRRKHGARTTFVRVAEVAVDEQSAPVWPATAGEISMVGVPSDWTHALDRVARVVRQAGRTPVSAFSLADLESLAEVQGRPLMSLLGDARAAGLEWIADAPVDRLRDVRAAFESVAGVGMHVARVTLAATHGEPGIELGRIVRGLAAEGFAIRAFAPLPRALASEPSTGYQDVKQVAIARLLIDNVSSIQVHWTLYGPKLAQVALTFGADDVDAVPAGEDQSVGARRQPLEEIRRNIRASLQTPVERNGRFETIDP
jgi:aminodeoxyfutalosine synthase